jgi:hypothetical protein
MEEQCTGHEVLVMLPRLIQNRTLLIKVYLVCQAILNQCTDLRHQVENKQIRLKCLYSRGMWAEFLLWGETASMGLDC